MLGLVVGGWYIVARETPARYPWISASETEFIQAGLPQEKSPGATLSWGAIRRSRDVLAVTLSYFTYGYAAYIFFSWFFIYLNAVRGLNLKQSSYYTMMPFLAMAIGSLDGGWFGAAAMLLAAVFIAMGSQVASPQLASFVLAGGAGALYLSQSSFWSVTADIGKRSAVSVSGIMIMGGQLSGAILWLPVRPEAHWTRLLRIATW